MTNNSNAVEVAVIGCGRIAGHHCRTIVDTDGVELVAVCDSVEDKAKNYSREYGVPYFNNYHEMFKEMPRINTAAIITPSGMHYEDAVSVMQNYRKNVIVEKPTFLRPSHLREAYALAKRYDLHVFPVFQNRYNRAVQRVYMALRNGELGTVRIAAVRVRWCRPQRYYELAPWRGKYSQDGGALTNQGIHHIDLLRYLVGDVENVTASMRTLGADIEVEDTVTATIEFANNSVGTLEITTAARPIDYEASISLVCEKGLAQIGGIAVNELQVFTPDESACSEWSEDFSECVYGNGHKEIYRNIVASMTNGSPYPVSQEDCCETIKLLHAFYRSDENCSWVSVDSDEESSRLGCVDEDLANLYRTPKLKGNDV